MDAALLGAGLAAHTERWRGGGRLAAVARELGKSRTAAMSRLARLKRAQGRRPGQQWTSEGLWTAAEDAAIRECLKGAGRRVSNGVWRSLDLPGRTVGAVATRACYLRRTLEA